MKLAHTSVAALVWAAFILPAGGVAWAADAPNAASKSASSAVTVMTVVAQAKDMAVSLKASGVVTPLTTIDVRSMVSSTIQKVHFQEGQFVQAGQLLFTLDSRADEANLAKAQAQLAKDQASLADAKRQLERARQLQAQNFVSQGAVDTALAQVEAQTATVAADQAAIDAVKVNLTYAQIKAPRSGRAGAVNLNVGSLVQANQTSLVTITQMDPMGVAFNLPQRNLQDALSALQKGGAPVQARLTDSGEAFQGKLQFVDSTVDASSGTVKAKAVFANNKLRLWPGAFVEVSQTVGNLKDAVVIPQNCIIQAARGAMVYVVEDGKALQRPVQVLYAEAGMVAVTGLKAGDKVVQDGKQNLRPNATVNVKEPSKDGAEKAAKPAAEKTP
ncbi:efflux RND transporter periplasmic adaptor subunit [Curvibacter sp. CHRR-16]|uniref:efflux RND transporter periplasmic adaptor subunit n=1 Tax=Curvibacter sp. CHRR-16 TaxID=2835872 RepID=UPI001BDB0404|nr:efflux RND transporter periplasmic adaptor subunit [Curvibacter sp. CHRR-16]MBT0570162.1 efflux RND transporter periplasmic adaptor subunit [Curvibacter sp. CHRR-16]